MDRHSIGDPKQRRSGLYATERSRLLEKIRTRKKRCCRPAKDAKPHIDHPLNRGGVSAFVLS